MASAGSIFVDLLLRDASYKQGLNRSRGYTSKWSKDTQGDVNKVSGAFKNSLNPINNFGSAISRLAGTFAAAISVQKVVQYSDTWRALSGRLSIVEKDMMAVGAAQESLFEVAQRNRQPLEGVISFYQRLNQFIPESVRHQYDLLGVTENVTAALAVTGETGASASAAMIQFTQAIGTNFEAAGQELRSIQEQAPRLAQALTNALGNGVKSLQQLKEEGLLTRDSVLRALGGMGEEGAKLAEELAKIPLTVSQAFTRLDNAFLKFIGQSEAINSGTSTLAIGITKLAENLDVLAKAIAAVAVVYSAKLVTTLGVSVGLWIANTRQVVLYQAALARMAGVSAITATSIGALSIASRAAAASMALLGGPIGLFIAVGYGAVEAAKAIVGENTRAAKASDLLAQAMSRVNENSVEYINASNQRRKAIRAETEEELKAAEVRIKVWEAQVAAFNNLNRVERTLGRIAGSVGLGPDLSSLGETAQGNLDLIRQARMELDKFGEIDSGQYKPFSLGGGLSSKEQKAAENAAEKQAKDLASIYEKYEATIKGVSKETINYQRALEELQLVKDAGMISDEEWIAVLGRLEREYKTSAIDLEAISKRAAENMQDAFADFLFDPFQDGLDGMLKGFIDTMRKMLAEQTSKQLFGALFGESGGLGGLLGGLFGGGSDPLAGIDFGFSDAGLGADFGGFFADGGYLEPGKWGIAGEQGAEPIFGGKTGVTVIPNSSGDGNNYTFNVGGDVSQEQFGRLERMVIATAGPGVVEKRVNDAKTRGMIQ